MNRSVKTVCVSILTHVKCLKQSRYCLSTNSTLRNDSKPSENNTNISNYDIVISGGGMVGAAMACILGKEDIFRNHKIALIETAKEKDYVLPEFYSNRVSALNQNSIDLLKSLGCFGFIENARYCKVKQMQVWEACTDSMINFKSEDQNDLAVIVENDLIQASLTKNLKSYDNVKVIYSNEIKDIAKDTSECVQLKLNDGSIINTKLLIGSDGHNSFVRKRMNFETTQYDYNQVAIVATLKLSDTHMDNVTAWQRFLLTGPLALLPLNNEYSSLVWSIEKQLSKELSSLSDEEFVNRLNHAFIDESDKNTVITQIDKYLNDALNFLSNTINQNKYISSSVRQLPPRVESCVPKSRASFPLSFSHSNNYVKNRIVLIGDAAHRIHPLAGQGVNLGFGDVTCLSDILKEMTMLNQDLSTFSYLQKYEQTRQKDAYPKILFIHFLNTLYSNRNSMFKVPAILLRSIGLTTTNHLSFIKNFYVGGAMK